LRSRSLSRRTSASRSNGSGPSPSAHNAFACETSPCTRAATPSATRWQSPTPKRPHRRLRRRTLRDERLRIIGPEDAAEIAREKASLQSLGAFTYGSNLPELFVATISPTVSLPPVLAWLQDEADTLGPEQFDFVPLFVASEHAREARAAGVTPGWLSDFL
jgi:hypothetical protein